MNMQMDFNIEVRKKQLQSLDEYITSSKQSVQSILDYLGWNGKKILDKEQETVCSVNVSHTVPLKNIDVHMRKCLTKTLGYESDVSLSVPLDDPSVIKLDPEKKIEILNESGTNNQLLRAAWNGQDYHPVTPNERLALYNYCVENTKSIPAPPEFNIQFEDKKEQTVYTHEELLAKERDAKRRRVKYKSVHTSRCKSYTEVMREVIANQMEQYKDYIANSIETSSQVERPSSSISRHSNRSSSSTNKYYKICTDTNGRSNGQIVKENVCVNDDVSPVKRNEAERQSSTVHDYPKKDTEYDRYKSHSGTDYRTSYKRSDDRSSKRSFHDGRRSKDYEYDYRHSREKRERYHKSERRY